jgi:hypothetical protein
VTADVAVPAGFGVRSDLDLSGWFFLTAAAEMLRGYNNRDTALRSTLLTVAAPMVASLSCEARQRQCKSGNPGGICGTGTSVPTIGIQRTGHYKNYQNRRSYEESQPPCTSV